MIHNAMCIPLPLNLVVVGSFSLLVVGAQICVMKIDAKCGISTRLIGI